MSPVDRITHCTHCTTLNRAMSYRGEKRRAEQCGRAVRADEGREQQSAEQSTEQRREQSREQKRGDSAYTAHTEYSASHCRLLTPCVVWPTHSAHQHRAENRTESGEQSALHALHVTAQPTGRAHAGTPHVALKRLSTSPSTSSLHAAHSTLRVGMSYICTYTSAEYSASHALYATAHAL